MAHDISDDAADPHSEVTSVIRHDVKPDTRADYEAWLKEIVPAAARFPGHRGVNVIRPVAGSTVYTIVLHFQSIEYLQHWLDSSERKVFIARLLPLLVGRDQVEIRTGLEFWFTPISQRQHALPYKQFLVTLSAIYPLSLLIPVLLGPALDRLGPLAPGYLRQFIIAAAIVGLMSYVIMPRYTRLIANWLYK